MKPIDYILNNTNEVLEFLKQHYPMHHLSNVFLRDIQYGIRTMLERKGKRVSYTESENIARAFVEKLEREQIFRPIDRQSWALNYPAFKKPPVVQATPAKQAPGAAPAKSPAATTPGAARPPLPPLSSAKPAGGGLPPLTSAKPAGAAPTRTATAPRPTDGQAQSTAATAEEPQQTQVSEATTASVQQPAPTSQQSGEQQSAPSSAPAASSNQQTPKRTLPPLKGNYKPVGKA